jgi:hypothetical protein
LTVLKVIVTIPLVLFLPGFTVFKSRLFREYRLHWLARLLFIIIGSAAFTSLLALFLAEAGYLRLWLLDLVLAAVTLLVVLAFGYTHRPVFLGATRREVLAVAALVVVGAALFFRPFEVVLGDGDPGYYFNTAYHLAHTGKMSIYDAAEPSMSDTELSTFYQKAIVQYMPYHLRVRSTGKVQPLLYHMTSAWMGMFIAVFGTWGGLYFIPLVMLLSVLVVYSLVRRFVGPFGAFTAALLMEFCFLVIYFARLPVSEVGCQLFLIAALLFYAEYSSSKGTATALATAMCATVAFLFRPEAIVAAVPLLVVEVVEVFRGRFERGDLVFTNVMLLGLLYNWLYMKYVGYFYLSTNMAKVSHLFGANGLNKALYIFLGLIVASGVFFNLPFLRRLCARLGVLLARAGGKARPASGAIVCGVMAAATLLAFVYLYFVAPAGAHGAVSSRWFFFYTAGYFGGISVFVFAVGLCLYIYSSKNAAFSFVLATSLIVLAAAFTESSVTSGYQPWLNRRFMSLVVALLFVGLGYLLGRLWDARRLYLRTAAVLAAALILGFFIYVDVPLVNFVQYKGVNSQLKAIAKKADGDLVLFTDPFAGEAIGLPLRYQFGVDARRVYDLSAGVDFAKTVRERTSKGQKVLIETKGLSTLNPSGELLDKVSFVRAFNADVSFQRMAQSYKVIPDRVGTEKHDLTFYYVVPKS